MDGILARQPNFFTAILLRTGILAKEGRENDAKEAMTDLQRINPNFRLAHAPDFFMNRDQEYVAAFTATLPPSRAAGMSAFPKPERNWMLGCTAAEKDVRAIRDWFAAWGSRVAEVNFAAARTQFDSDVLGFGTSETFLNGLEALETRQWRAVWPTIEDFRFNLDTLRVGVSADRRMAFALLTFDSTGIAKDGKRYPRPGRVTAIFGRAQITDGWLAVHTHLSLNRGVPEQSYGERPEHA